MSKRIAITGLLIAGVLALASGTQPWVRVTLEQGISAQPNLAAAGNDANAALTPIAIAILALGIALTIAGKVFRYILAAIAVLLGVGLVWAGISGLANPIQGASIHLQELTGLTGGAQFEVVQGAVSTLWPYATVAAGALSIVAGVIVAVRSATWKTGGRKYEQNSAQQPGQEPDRVSDWDMLTHGEDPSDER